MADSSGMMNRRRVVVTGLGAVSPLGNDAASTWRGFAAGVCGVGNITRFDTAAVPAKIAAEVKNFDPAEYISRKEARRLSRFILYALASARQAQADAALDMAVEDPTRIGVEIGSALGGLPIIEAQSVTLHQKGYRRINPTLIPATLVNMAASFSSIDLHVLGPVSAPVAACATGIVAIGQAMRRIQWGEADVMFAGAADSAITPIAVLGFHRLGALTARNDTPERAITPFDAKRDGTVLGEGAAVLVLESLSHAQTRGAKILAEVTGYATTADAFHVAAPAPDADGATRAIVGAMRDADISPAEIGYIAAHGTGTPLNDAAETRAIKRACGDAAANIPISSQKSMVGHTLGAAGALASLAAVQVLQTGTIPPTIGLHTPDPDCDLDYVPNVARQGDVQYAMANAFGFGGQNAVIIFKKWQPPDSFEKQEKIE